MNAKRFLRDTKYEAITDHKQVDKSYDVFSKYILDQKITFEIYDDLAQLRSQKKL